MVAEIGVREDNVSSFLELHGANRSIRIDEDGIQVSPSKPARFTWDFVAEHPEDPTKEIHYAVTEGPEAGVFVRGTARLARGRARVALPSHFAHVASPAGLTAHLTPRSKRSKGVAATQVSVSEILIEELHRGRGAYEVDYFVQGVRKGHEDYEVVRPRRTARGIRAA